MRSVPPTSSGTARGGPAKLKGEDIPVASRLAQIGEFVEVAHRIGGIGAAVALADKRAGSQFDPSLAAAFCANAETILDGSRRRRDLGRGDRRRTRSRRVPGRGAIRTRRCGPSPISSTSSRPTRWAMPALSRISPAVPAPTSGLNDVEAGTLRRAGVVHGLGRLGVSNAIWDKRGPLGCRGVGAGADAPLPHRADAASVARRLPRWGRSRCNSASVSTARATREGSPGRRSRYRPGYWGRPTPTSRCASLVPTARP